MRSLVLLVLCFHLNYAYPSEDDMGFASMFTPQRMLVETFKVFINENLRSFVVPKIINPHDYETLETLLDKGFNNFRKMSHDNKATISNIEELLTRREWLEVYVIFHKAYDNVMKLEQVQRAIKVAKTFTDINENSLNAIKKELNKAGAQLLVPAMMDEADYIKLTGLIRKAADDFHAIFKFLQDHLVNVTMSDLMGPKGTSKIVNFFNRLVEILRSSNLLNITGLTGTTTTTSTTSGATGDPLKLTTAPPLNMVYRKMDENGKEGISDMFFSAAKYFSKMAVS